MNNDNTAQKDSAEQGQSSALNALLADLRVLQHRGNCEYEYFYKIQEMSPSELKKNMKDSDFDRMQNGTHTELECCELFRAKCRGRMTSAGNFAGQLRCIINMHS